MTTVSPLPAASAETRMQAIAARLQGADWMGAAALAQAALEAGDSGPMLHKLRALARQQAGRWSAAAEDLRITLGQWPTDFSAWNLLGFCEARAGHPETAVVALDHALQLHPAYAPAYLNKAWALELLGELKAAKAAYQKAGALDPDDPRPGAALALLAARAADWPTARRLADETLARDPAQTAAHLALAMTDLGQDEPAAALQRLDAVLSNPALDAHDRAVGLGFKGDALDRLDRTAEAFAAFTAANAGLAQVYAGALEGREGGTARALRLTASLAVLPAAPPVETAPDPHRPAIAGHVFLLGFPRSGTTLLGQILDAHPGIVTLDERETLAEAAGAFLDTPDGLARLAAAPPAEIGRLRAAYWDRVRRGGLDLDGRLFVDKLPLNTIGLPLIARLFPHAKAVFMRRDPRDVVLSSFRQRFAVGPSTAEFLTLQGAALFYDAVMSLAEACMASFKLDLRIQGYEALTTDFEGETRALCDFLDTPWNAAMAGFADRADVSAVATPSAVQIARGLYRDGAGQWRRYAAELAPVLPLLAPWVARFGYADA